MTYSKARGTARLVLVIVAALASAIASLSVGSGDAAAKSTTALLSGGNLPAPISIPAEGLLGEAMAARQGLFARAGEADSYPSTYGISYTLTLESDIRTSGGTYLTSPGAYFPRPAPNPGLWVAGFNEQSTYVATPEWDHVLKIYLVAALSGQDPAVVPVSAAGETLAVPAFDQLMSDLGIGLVTWDEAKRMLPAAPIDSAQDSTPVRLDGPPGDGRSAALPVRHDGPAGDGRSAAPVGLVSLAVFLVVLGLLVAATVHRRRPRPESS